MREIKFRAWDGSEMYPFDLNSIDAGSIMVLDTSPKSKDSWAAIKDLAVMQFTGLLDKNGKEIYEEDIVTCEIHEREQYDEYYSGMPLVVSFDSQCAGFYPFTKASQWRSSVKDIVVIGNIHQNSELLETKPPQP